MQLLIQLRGLRAQGRQLFDFILQLDAREMLPGVEEQTSRHRAARRHTPPEILQTRRSHGTDQPRIINSLNCVIFSHQQSCGAVRCSSKRVSAVATLSITRIFALRDRGLLAISGSPGWITFLVSMRNPSCESRWKACFTTRSSSE